MLITEQKLVYLIEECSEVIKVASKILRFGSDDFNPDTNIRNSDALRDELCDLQAVLELFEVDPDFMDQAIEAKLDKLEYFEPLERLMTEEI